MRSKPRPYPLLSLLLAATILALAALPGTAAGFGDVDDDQYYADPVAWMVQEGVTTGIEAGCFGPTLNVTRGQVATFLHRLEASLGNDPGPGTHPFIDVTASYQQEPVGWLYESGLTTGVSPLSFQPQQSITRGDFAVLLWRYAGAPQVGTSIPFTDVDRPYQRNAIAWLASEDITTGTTPTTFEPDGVVSRAEAATFLYRFVAPGADATPLPEAQCTRELRVALELGGMTPTESRCAIPHLIDFDVEELVAIVQDEATASFEVILAAVAIGNECLTYDRIADLSRVFL